MFGIDTDYRVEALDVLLNENCISERYYPLIPYKELLRAQLPLLGCHTKNDAAALSDDALLGMGLPDVRTLALLRRFFSLYEPDPKKFREIEKICADPAEQAAFRELYHLPGVRAIRAKLYCRAGYRSLRNVADATPEEMMKKTALVIQSESLPCIAPLPKEARTQIAVARSFLL